MITNIIVIALLIAVTIFYLILRKKYWIENKRIPPEMRDWMDEILTNMRY